MLARRGRAARVLRIPTLALGSAGSHLARAEPDAGTGGGLHSFGRAASANWRRAGR